MIFLAANQIKMLGLTRKQDGQSLLDALRQVDEKNQNKILEAGAKHVAFTDPNDLLSYETEPPTKPDHINVRITNEPALLGIVADPWKVHTGYLKNVRVWDYIMCGHDRTC